MSVFAQIYLVVAALFLFMTGNIPAKILGGGEFNQILLGQVDFVYFFTVNILS